MIKMTKDKDTKVLDKNSDLIPRLESLGWRIVEDEKPVEKKAKKKKG